MALSRTHNRDAAIPQALSLPSPTKPKSPNMNLDASPDQVLDALRALSTEELASLITYALDCGPDEAQQLAHFGMTVKEKLSLFQMAQTKNSLAKKRSTSDGN